MRPTSKVIACVLITGALSSCNFNLFDPLDSPTSDAQYLSAARACLDRGDIACAKDNYAKLSSNYADIQNSEEAFATLYQYGAGFNAFASAFGRSSQSAGTSITHLAGSLTSVASSDTRLQFFRAFKQGTLVSDINLKSLIQLVSGLALISELLAEDATTRGTFINTDFVTDPTTCAALSSINACAGGGAASCGKPAGKKLAEGPQLPSTLDNITDENLIINTSGSNLPTLNLIYSAINAVQNALTHFQHLGNFANASQTFSSSVLSSQYVNSLLSSNDSTSQQDNPCFRFGLLTNDIGKN